MRAKTPLIRKGRQKTPQEKKALSRAKDRRGSYGQNDKAARNLIPIRKAQSHRKIRRVSKAALQGDPEISEATFQEVRTARWRKWPGTTLGDGVDRKLRDRAYLRKTAHLGPQGRARLRIERMRQWKTLGRVDLNEPDA